MAAWLAIVFSRRGERSSSIAPVTPTPGDATLDVLRYLARRLDGLRAVLVLTFSDVEVDAGHPLQRLLGTLAEAEEHGIIEVGVDGIAFRHELARRAVEHSLPGIRRCTARWPGTAGQHPPDLNQPDLARLVHHAVAAADAATVVEYAPRAGREAARAGSHRQALAHYEAALQHADLLGARERAQVLDVYAWELCNAHRFADAVTAGRDVLTSTGCPQALAQASAYRGATLALTNQFEDAVTTLEQARDRATDLDRPDLVALCLNYLGVARAGLGEPDALVHLRESLAMARRGGFHEYGAGAYTNLGAILYRLGRYDELTECLDAVREASATAHAGVRS